ncbi:MAG: cupin domain-containing protein [Planctomycetota bacterium]|jgi:1,2-dihydroxy-3-keto-5-methylthiopentene dioxygenase
MAVVLIPDENRALKSEKEIQEFINPHGIFYEKWPLAERVNPEADADDILKAYAPEIEVLKKKGGYVTADVMNVSPETPNLDEMMAKYKMEHTHSEDEVRFILKGKGLFHIHPTSGPIFAIQVEAGDLINVPRGTKHWFGLCEDRTIRAIRLFQDKSGWTPQYIDSGIHGNYAPLCWGPTYLTGEGNMETKLSV